MGSVSLTLINGLIPVKHEHLGFLKDPKAYWGKSLSSQIFLKFSDNIYLLTLFEENLIIYNEIIAISFNGLEKTEQLIRYCIQM